MVAEDKLMALLFCVASWWGGYVLALNLQAATVSEVRQTNRNLWHIVEEQECALQYSERALKVLIEWEDWEGFYGSAIPRLLPADCPELPQLLFASSDDELPPKLLQPYEHVPSATLGSSVPPEPELPFVPKPDVRDIASDLSR